MATSIAALLTETIQRELPHLEKITDEAAAQNDGRPGSWTRQQELGHLIDSATNNHLRIALAEINGEFRGPGYAQEQWVEAHGYSTFPWRSLVDLWYQYNSLLAHLMARVPDAHMNNACVIGSNHVTLQFVMQDYVRHMQHHLDHILARRTNIGHPNTAAAV